MKKAILFLTLLAFSATACSESDDVNLNDPNGDGPVAEVPQHPERVDFELLSVDNSGIAGTASFIPRTDGSTTIYIELTGTNQEIHPAAVHFGSIQDGGPVAITLNACECRISETVVTRLDDGSPIDFVGLMGFDGHLNITEGPGDDTVVAHANIGSNAF